jgi:FAD binding domain
MGLNGGIQDAVNLSAKLVSILLGGESDRSLDLYNLQRRTVATEFVQEQSIANKKRLEESDPKTRQKKSGRVGPDRGESRAGAPVLASDLNDCESTKGGVAYPQLATSFFGFILGAVRASSRRHATMHCGPREPGLSIG